MNYGLADILVGIFGGMLAGFGFMISQDLYNWYKRRIRKLPFPIKADGSQTQ